MNQESPGSIMDSIARYHQSISNLTINKLWTAAFVRELLPPVKLHFRSAKKNVANILDAKITGRKNAFATVNCQLPHYGVDYTAEFSWETIAKSLNRSDGVISV